MKQAEERAALDSVETIAPLPEALTIPGSDLPEALGPGDTIADDISTTATLTVGGTVTSTIEVNNDADFFRVTLQAGRAYVVQMTRTSGNSLDPWVKFHNSAGAVISNDDDGGIRQNSALVLRPDVSGTYYVSANSFTEQGQGSSGGYQLSLTEIPRSSTSPTDLGATSKTSYSWDEAAIQLTRNGHSWAQSFGAPVTVTYAFRASAPAANTPETGAGFQRFNENQIAAAEQALQQWASLANINFVRVGAGNSGDAAYSDSAAILFSNYTISPTGTTSGQAYLPTSGDQSSGSVQGDVFINISNANNANPIATPGAYGTLVHEIGHALGLHHPSEYNGGSPTYASDASYREDSNQWTVMSYFAPSNTGAVMTGWSQMPALHDVAAIQRLYGANMSTRTGNDTYGFNNTTGLTIYGPSTSNSMYFTIWDGGGNDTLDLSGYSTLNTIDLREEAFSSAGLQVQSGGPAKWNINIARGAVIENAVGGPNTDVIYGNAVANLIRGGTGDDQLFGFGGDDELQGESGVDQLDGGAGADRVFGGADNDLLTARQGEFVTGDQYDGGVSFNDMLRIAGVVDLRIGVFLNFERLGFAGHDGAAFNRAIVNLSQLAGFATGLVLSDGSGLQSSLQIIVPVGATADVSGYQFSFGEGWGFDDYIVYTGDAGGETFVGFPGLDIFFAGAGNDVMDGRDASDFAAYIFSLDAVTADLSIQGTAQFISASQGSDTFINLEGVAGSQMSDTLFGSNQDNFLLGLHGNDALAGRGGADDIRGGEHADRIDGGMGADTLWGGAPAETLSGPDGADVFVYHNAAEGGDTIRDFQASVDTFEFSAAGFGLTAGAAVQLVTGVNPAPTAAGPQVLVTTNDGTLGFNTRVFFDADGTGGAASVLIATLSGNVVLTASNFVVTSIGGASLGVETSGAEKSIDAFDFRYAEASLADLAPAPVLEAFDVAPLAAEAFDVADLPQHLHVDGVLGQDTFNF